MANITEFRAVKKEYVDGKFAEQGTSISQLKDRMAQVDGIGASSSYTILHRLYDVNPTDFPYVNAWYQPSSGWLYLVFFKTHYRYNYSTGNAKWKQVYAAKNQTFGSAEEFVQFVRDEIADVEDTTSNKQCSYSRFNTTDYSTSNISKENLDTYIAGTPSDRYYQTPSGIQTVADLGDELKSKTEKTRIDFDGTNFKIGTKVLNYKQLYDIHISKPDFGFVVYGDRAYLLSYVQDDDGMKEMRFQSTIAVTNSDGTSTTKTSGIYVISSDGVAISSVRVADINSENSSNKVSEFTEANKNSENHYPSNAAVTKELVEVKSDLRQKIDDAESRLSESIVEISDDILEHYEVGKQLFDFRRCEYFNGYFTNSAGLVADDNMRTAIIPVVMGSNTSITVHRDIKGHRFSVGAFTEYPIVGTRPTKITSNNDADSITISNITDIVKYILVFAYNKTVDTSYTAKELFDSIMVQFGTEFTGYEHYGIAKGMGELAKGIEEHESNILELDERLEKVEDVFENVRTPQLLDYKNMRYINAYMLADGFHNDSRMRTVIIPIQNNDENHVIAHRDIISSRFAIGAFTSENPTTGDVPVWYENKNSSDMVHIPIDSAIKSICVFAYNSSLDTAYTQDEIFSSIMVQFGTVYTGYEPYGTKQVVSSDQIGAESIQYRHLSGDVKERIERTVFDGLKMNCLGDSFTDDNISYEHVLKDRFPLLTTVHVAKGGSAICKDIMKETLHSPSFINRIDGTAPDYDRDPSGNTKFLGLATDADITVIMGGINDCFILGNGQITMGNIDSEHNVDTFYGGMQLLLDRIIQMVPDQFILGVVPPTFTPSAPYTTYIGQVQNAEREIYRKYHIPFVDLAYDCFAMSDNPTVMARYRKSVTGSTNYHPNADGHKKICNLIQGKLEMMIK